jgi:hypothetical protein
MICEACHGLGLLMVIVPDKQHGALGTTKPCLECNGSGIASCCDAAGSSDHIGDVNKMVDRYRDDAFEPELCHHCGVSYRGPALYCSLTCAIADA